MDVYKEAYRQHYTAAGKLAKAYRDHQVPNSIRNLCHLELPADLERLVLDKDPIAMGIIILESISEGLFSRAIPLCEAVRDWNQLYQHWQDDTSNDKVVLYMLKTLFELEKGPLVLFEPGHIYCSNGLFSIKVETTYLMNGDRKRVADPQAQELFDAKLYGEVSFHVDNLTATIGLYHPHTFLERLINAIKKRGIEVCSLPAPYDELPW